MEKNFLIRTIDKKAVSLLTQLKIIPCKGYIVDIIVTVWLTVP